jgi:hypothetical protein
MHLRLILVLVVGLLISCSQPEEPQPWPDCDPRSEFVADYGEGEGFDTAVAALAAHTQTEPLPGTAVLEVEEADLVTWNLYDGERLIGEITAEKTSADLWIVSNGAWCEEEFISYLGDNNVILPGKIS